MRGEAASAQQTDRLVRHQAKRATAVRHDLLAGRQFGQVLPEFAQRHGPGMRQMPCGIFRIWTNVNDDDIAPAGLGQQRVTAFRAQHIGAGGHLIERQAQLHKVFLGDFAHVHPQACHIAIAEAVVDEFALAPGLDQTRLSQGAQVGTGKAHVHAGLHGQQVNGFLALSQQLDQLKPLWARQRIADAGNVFIELGFGDIWHRTFILKNIGLIAMSNVCCTPQVGGVASTVMDTFVPCPQ